MTDITEPSVRKFGQYFAGVLAGAIMAILLLAGILTLMTPFYPGEEGLSILAFAVLGLLPSLILGGTLGALFIRIARRAINPRRTASIGAAVYIFTIIIGAVGVPALIPTMDGIARDRRNVRVRELVGQSFERAQNSWKNVYVNQYPYTDDSLPKILGPLQYPNARLVSWNDVPGNVSGWDILTGTDDSADKVLAFYASMLPQGIEGYPGSFPIGRTGDWSTMSEIVPSIDDVEVRVIIEGSSSGMHIRYKFYSPIIVVQDVSQPWSKVDSQAFLQDSRSKQLEYHAAIDAEYADWLYPGATYTWGNLASKKQLAYETTDSLSQVIAHYESVKGKSSVSDGQYRFDQNHDKGWNPEFTVYQVGDKVRIHFRYFQ